MFFLPKMLALHSIFIHCWKLELSNQRIRFTLYLEKLVKISLKAITENRH